MGGFGAFALWTDSATLASSGTIASGQLDLTVASEDGKWYLENPQTNNAGTGPVEIANLATYKISPGDQLSFKGNTYTGYVKGSDIQAQLEIAGTTGDAITNAALNGLVDVEYKIGNSAATAAPVLQGTIAKPEAYLSGGNSNDAVAVSVYLTFKDTADAANTQALDKAIDFTGGLDLVLKQI
jgi:alternate signal-mediated exported protein